MHLKIYFNDKPLFLCDDIDQEIAPSVHHDDAIFIDEFSTRAINSMIHEMKEQKIHVGIFYHSDLEELKKAVWKKFTVVRAAGGLVMNEKQEFLMIYRKGKWDLPKGKLDHKELPEKAAVREIMEETGLTKIQLKEFITTTYHTYDENGKHILKETSWYVMEADSLQKLTPQLNEQITKAEWVNQNNLEKCLKNAFPSIREVFKVFFENHQMKTA